MLDELQIGSLHRCAHLLPGAKNSARSKFSIVGRGRLSELLMVMRRRSKIRPMNADSRADSDSCFPPTFRCISTRSQNCWQSTSDFVVRTWEASVVFIADSWVCISRRCCNNVAESEIVDSTSIDSGKHDQLKVASKDGSKEQPAKQMSPSAGPRIGSSSGPNPQQMTKPSSPVQSGPQTISSTQTTVMSQPPSPSGSQTSSPRSTSTPTATRSPTQAQTQTTASASIQPSAHLRPASPGAPSESTVRSSLTGPSNLATQNQEFEVTLPEPPKIDFIETGSIFGDRKRPTIDQTMFQMENGRFRSPGQSKVIQGPGGRTIRVSFVSGFPATKSIESYRSLTPSQGGKLTRKSTDSVSASADRGGLEAGGSKIRKVISQKSFKSQTSQDSRDSGPNQNSNDKFNK